MPRWQRPRNSPTFLIGQIVALPDFGLPGDRLQFMNLVMEYKRGQGIPIQPMLWGIRKRCPSCGKSHIFQAYLKPVDSCDLCHAEFRDIRTDDIAPYFTILIVGHIIAPLLFYVETTYAPAVWIHWTIWPAMTVLLSLWCLPRVKGAALAVMWHLRLRGDETQ